MPGALHWAVGLTGTQILRKLGIFLQPSVLVADLGLSVSRY